jgi:putative transcriptional regulator
MVEPRNSSTSTAHQTQLPAKAVRFTTLAALCEVLECQPGDLLRWEPSADRVMPAAGDPPAARA